MYQTIPEHEPPGRRRFRARALPALALLLTACSNPRSDAAAELLRLDEALQAHAASYGRFPDTIDPALPPGPANVAFAPERNVTLRLLTGPGDRYSATARAGVWLCHMSVTPERRTLPDCTPVGSGSGEAFDSVEPPGAIFDPEAGDRREIAFPCLRPARTLVALGRGDYVSCRPSANPAEALHGPRVLFVKSSVDAARAPARLHLTASLAG